MTSLAILDQRADGLFIFGEEPVRVSSGAHSGCVWNEGPVWLDAEQALLWSDIPNNRMMRWHAQEGTSVWRAAAEFTNGHALDAHGNILHCSHGLRAIVRTVAGRGDEILVDRYKGARLNSPNDIVVKSDGTIWFTDPPYGIRSDREGHAAPSELPGNFVFRFDPASGALDVMADTVEEPNGLAFSPDESILYVSDTAAVSRPGGGHHIVQFHVAGDGSLGPQRPFVTIAPGVPDGFKVDSRGWVYSSSESGVQVFAEDGTPIARIDLPEKVGNLVFGGPANDTLYICASTSIYRIRLNARGAVAPPAPAKP